MMAFDIAQLPLVAPEIDETTAPYWTGAAKQQLLAPWCSAGHHFWIPRSFCPEHPDAVVTPAPMSGRGTIYSFTVIHKGEGQFSGAAPYVLAYVELDEGPRLMTNIVDCDEQGLRIGLPVEAAFHGDDPSWAIPRFRPASGGHPR